MEGPVALSSKLGYILSGPTCGGVRSNTNIVNTHVLRVQAELIQNDLGKYESWNFPNNIKEIINFP